MTPVPDPIITCDDVYSCVENVLIDHYPSLMLTSERFEFPPGGGTGDVYLPPDFVVINRGYTLGSVEGGTIDIKSFSLFIDQFQFPSGWTIGVTSTGTDPFSITISLMGARRCSKLSEGVCN